MKLVKEFLYEIIKSEDVWANTQIDDWNESQKSSEDDLKEYNQKIVDSIWKRLTQKLSPKQLKYTNTTKKSIDDLINIYNEEGGFYMSVADYWEENTPWDETANLLFDECYRNITAQGWVM